MMAAGERGDDIRPVSATGQLTRPYGSSVIRKIHGMIFDLLSRGIRACAIHGRVLGSLPDVPTGDERPGQGQTANLP